MSAEPAADIPLDVIADHVVRTPGVCGGRPRIKGTRITVWHVARWHHIEGRSVAAIVSGWPQLSSADIHAALAYYDDHREEVDAEQAAAEAAVERMAHERGHFVDR